MAPATNLVLKARSHRFSGLQGIKQFFLGNVCAADGPHCPYDFIAIPAGHHSLTKGFPSLSNSKTKFKIVQGP